MKFTERDLDNKLRSLCLEDHQLGSIRELVEWLSIFRNLSVYRQKLGDSDGAYIFSILALKCHRNLIKVLKIQKRTVMDLFKTMHSIAEIPQSSDFSEDDIQIYWNYLFGN